jgi:hypothetical protein
MRRAELGWIEHIVKELKDGTLEWPKMVEHEWPMA